MIAERDAQLARPEVLSPRHLSSPEANNEFSKKVFSGITEYLSKHERFASQSKVYQKVQGRFQHLYPDSKVELLVVNDKEPNAFATPAYMVVSNGLLRLIEGEEELDAVIAHEMVHLEREHLEHGVDSGSFIKRIGRTRTQETEADIRPLEFLDKKGVNPYGFIKLFEHLEEYHTIKKQELDEHFKKIDPTSKVYNDKWKEAHGDAEHGSFLDRRLNFSQSSWFIDIRNLSLDLKPLNFNEDELNAYETDEITAGRFDILDPTEKRILLKRQFRKYTQDPQTELDDEKQGFAKLSGFIENQKKLIDEIFPGTSEDNKSTMLLLTLQSDYGIDYRILQKIPSMAELVSKWDTGLGHPASVIGFVEATNSSELEKIGFDNNSERAQDFRLKMLKRYLEKQEIISPDSFFHLYDQVNSLSKVDLSNAVKLLIEKLTEKNQFNPACAQDLSALLRDRPLIILDIVQSQEAFEEWIGMNNSSLDYQSKEIPIEVLLIEYLEGKRIAKLRTLKDPLEFFRYLDVWYDFGGGASAIEDSITNLISEQFNQKLEVFINQVKDHLNKPDEKEQVFFLGGDTFEQLLGTYFSELSYSVESESGKKLTQQKLQSFLELIGLTQSQENMVSMINDALGIADFKKISSSGLESILISINKAVSEGGIHSGKEISPMQLKKMPRLVQAAKVVFLNEAVKSGDLGKLKKYFSLFPSYNVQPAIDLIREISDLEVYKKVLDEEEYPPDWESMLGKAEIDTKKDWDLLTQKVLNDKSLEPQSRMEMLMFLSSSSEDPQILLQVVPEIALRMVKGVDFKEGVSIVFEKYPMLPQHVFSKALNYLIEEKAKTAADFDLLEDKVKSSIESFVTDEESLGTLAVADAFILEPVKGIKRNLYNEGLSFIDAKIFDPLELIKSLLVFESDEKLKRYLFERWWIFNQNGSDIDSSRRKIFNLDEYFSEKNAQNTLENWKKTLPSDREYKSLNEVISQVYLMNTVMKFALLRKILTGTSGVLANDEGKEQFAEFISESLLTSEDGGSLDFTRDLITSLFKAGDQEELFDRTSPVIADLMLSKPEQTYRYDEMAIEYAKQFLIFAQTKGNFSYRTNAEAREHIKNVATKIYRLMGSPASRSKSGIVPEISSNLRLMEEFQESNNLKELKKFTPWDLAITVGQKSGALGVKMLQLAGQYFDIPLKQRESLDSAYDQNIGQSRLQAYRTLKREAETSPDIARFLENVEEFLPRIGGGSLMTVYEFKMKDGTREAVAVRNPNVTFHLDKIVKLLRKTLSEARMKNPEDQNYQLMEVLLDDVAGIIKDELSDPDFEIKDGLFRLQNDGWYPENNSNKRILIPESLPTGTRWVRRDRLIPGKNLTGLNVSEGTDIAGGKISQEDMRQITSLIVKKFLAQLFETGLVHSDLHPGNIRVTPDGTQVAIFDRYNLLKLSELEKEFIGGLVAASAFGMGAIQDQLGNYLFSLDENAEKVTQKDQMLSEVERIFRSHSNSEEGLTNAMVYLKRSGIIIPRNISLIAKNLYSLNKLSKFSGFNSLIEAFMAA